MIKFGLDPHIFQLEETYYKSLRFGVQNFNCYIFCFQTSSSLIEGRWQLMFTTRPGTASPIQVVSCPFGLSLFV